VLAPSTARPTSPAHPLIRLPRTHCALVRVSPPPTRRGTARVLVHQRTGNMSRARHAT
jgi:hypothetical protein